MASMLPTVSEGFTNESLKGNYAVTCIGQGGQAESATVGVYTFDGSGNMSGSTITNLPGSAFGERVLAQASLTGSYNVDADGSGYGSSAMLIALPSGLTREISTVLLITRAEVVNNLKIAQEICLMENNPDPVTGSLNMIFATRHPDEGEFSLASFQGTYGGPGIGRGNQVPAAAIGVGAVNFDGNGRFTAVDIQNLPAALFGERRTATFDTPGGRYLVNKDGTGTIIGENGQAALVITRARVVSDVRIAQEYFFVTNDLLPPTGNLVTTLVTKRLF